MKQCFKFADLYILLLLLPLWFPLFFLLTAVAIVCNLLCNGILRLQRSFNEYFERRTVELENEGGALFAVWRTLRNERRSINRCLRKDIKDIKKNIYS
jgi:hypothetical protein